MPNISVTAHIPIAISPRLKPKAYRTITAGADSIPLIQKAVNSKDATKPSVQLKITTIFPLSQSLLTMNRISS